MQTWTTPLIHFSVVFIYLSTPWSLPNLLVVDTVLSEYYSPTSSIH